ncbi:YciI family protein [Nannocystaceae bacterium ST9]
MMMVKASEDYEAGRPPPPALMARMAEYSAEMAKRGVLLETSGLAPSSMGARIHLAGGTLTVMDGPFSETKELVGGYAIIRAETREQAIEFGKDFMKVHVEVLGPGYSGALEIRQLFDPNDCMSR